MTDRDGFLTRWSRRKLGVEHEEPHPDAPQPEGAARDEVEAEGAASRLSDEEIAALPRPEDLTPESNISAFLRKGVPEVLRKAALRRIWSLDPAIRDYVGDARDYAWDWNVPGGVPGYGPLLPSEEVTQRLERMFSTAPSPVPSREIAAEGEAATARPASLAGQPDAVAADAALVSVADSNPAETEDDLAACGLNEDFPDEERAPAPHDMSDGNGQISADRAGRPRRHGAALPKFDSF